MTVCLCGGMTTPRDPTFYQNDVENLAERLAHAGETVLLGGVTTGIIGQFADAFVSKGGKLEGTLIPEEEADRHPALSNLHRFATYDARQDFMFSQASSVFFLPGGLGTFHECFSLLLKHKMKNSTAPTDQKLILLNWKGFWSPVQTLLKEACRQGFLTPHDIDSVLFEEEEPLPSQFSS